MINHLINKIINARHTLCIILPLTLTLTSCADPSAGTGVPEFFRDAKVISAGYNYTSAIKNDGTLWEWGICYNDRFNDNRPVMLRIPVQIGTDTNWKSVSAVSCYTVAIKDDGTLWAWGDNSSGQLGNSTTDTKYSPVQVGTDKNWRSVSAGSDHAVAIKTDGSLWAWGGNESGQLGNGGSGSGLYESSPVPIGTDFVIVSAGNCYTIAIKDDGTLWYWGDSHFVDGTATNKTVPTQITFVANEWVAVSAKAEHGAAIKSNGTLWEWGYTSGCFLPNPVQVGTENNWKSVSAGWYYTAAIKTDGTLWTWGRNDRGQLGDGTTTDRSSPVKIGDRWSAVSSNNDECAHTVAIRGDGVVWSWGGNNAGQLGDGTAIDRPTPNRVILRHR